MNKEICYHGVPEENWGIWNKRRHSFQFTICKDTPMMAEARPPVFWKSGRVGPCKAMCGSGGRNRSASALQAGNGLAGAICGGRDMKLIIPFPLPGLNEYIEAERRHRQKGAAMKREYQRAVELAVRRQLKGCRFREPVVMCYTWVERDRRRDKDNVSSFGRKVIQDALVGVKALRNDGWANIEDFSDSFQVDRKHPRVEIEITEAET